MIAASACVLPQYSTAGNTAGCDPCPAGFRCPSPAAIPEECPAGYYSPVNVAECTICPAGSYCPDKAFTPTTLTVIGTYTEAGAPWYSVVPPGSLWVSFSQKPVSCGDSTGSTAGSGGSYWDLATASCKICPIGSFCPSNMVQGAIVCPDGFMAPITGMTACLACPAGYKCTGGVATQCSTTAGSFEYSYPMQNVCVLCPAGYSCKDQASVPFICASGTSSAAGEQMCAPCAVEGRECSGMDVSSAGTSCANGEFRINQQSTVTVQGGQDYSLPVCRACPAGFKCTSTSLPPTPCNPGEYQNQMGQTTCIACPAGQACPYRDALPYSCPTGYTVTADKTGCTANAPATACSTVSGSYEFSWPNPGTCLKCPEGFECQSTNGPPRKCIPGYYSLAGYQYCTRCEAGSACPSEYGTQKVATCSAGFYSLGGSLNCYAIPPRMAGTTSSKPNWCNFLAGEVSATGSATCSACGLNKQCPNDNLTPISCPLNEFTSRADETQCHPTISYGKLQVYPAVAVAPGMDVEVGIGKIGYRGMSTLDGSTFDAPPGYMAMMPFSQNWTQCPPGYYSPDLFWTCQPCPEGQNCPLRHNTATPNNQGYWSPLGVHIPLVVPAGWKAGTTQAMQPCNPGEYSESNKSSCTKCNSGQVCPQTSNAPLACNEGFESKNDAPQAAGQFACAPCDKDEYFDETTKICTAITPGYGAIHPMFALQKCLFGQYSSAASIIADGQLDCQPCTEGKTCGSAATSAAGVACPNGYWCSSKDENVPQLRKYPCPAGTKANSGTNFSTMETACAICTGGNYCNGRDTTETLCPAGYFCPPGTKWSTQFPCLAGTKKPSTGGQSAASCVACSAGEYCPQGTATAFACPPQSACTNSSPVQDPAQDQCSDGTYPIAGVCTTCSAGNFCITGVSTQQMCPAGRKRSTTGAKNRYEDCVECSAGELCPIYGMTAASANYACVAGSGYICAIGTEFKQSFPCPAGTQDATTTTSPALISNCVTCPAGYACPEGTGTIATSNQKIQCEPGYYCDGGITHPRQKPCTGGKYNPTRGSSSSADCQNCSAGYYCPEGSYRQYKCPSGYYCLANTYDYTLTHCPAGTYRQDQQGASLTDCTTCPAGHYCEISSVMPTFCPVGTYRSTTGAKSAYSSTATSVSAVDSCLMCTAGYKCPFVGMTAALKCPAGYYSPAGSQVCFKCRAGFRCDTTSVTALDLTAYETSPSASFYTQVISLGGVQTYSSGTCSKGHYCPEDALYEIPCPVGTINDLTGQTSITACLNVADTYPGYYANQPGSYWDLIVSNKCAPGYYCTVAAKSAYDKPCKVGMYNDKEGQSVCVVCTAGNYCLGGANNSCPAPCTTFYPTISYWPIVCPAGFFCEAGVDVPSTDPTYYKNFPQPCPKGTYGGSVGLKLQSQCTICDPGRFCAEVGAKSPTGLCDAGFYCVNSYDGINNIGSTTPQPPNSGAAIPNDYTPLNAQIGGPCPIGGYCEAGSFQAKACPGGFYHYRDTTLAYIGLKTIFDCTVCPAGQYCGGTVSASAGQGAPTDYCETGFYCQAQSTVKDQFPSPPGYYTRKGSALPSQCEVGTYNNKWHMGDTNKNYPTVAPGEPGGTVVINLTNQDIFYDPLGVIQHVHCPYCKEGFYCDQIGMSDNIKPCPVGKFCTIGKFYKGLDPLDNTKPAWFTNPVSCLPGTYNPTPYATTIAHCLSCPPGKYCAGKALDAPSGDCLAGYFCKTGSLEQQPAIPDNSVEKKWGYCPEGSYCIAGTAYPAPCPPGTFGAATTLQAANQCTPCTQGYYCPNAGMKTADLATTTYQCEAGYYCPTGSKSPRASACTAGRKCPAGSATETACPNGYYQNNVQQSDCILCPAGYFCFSATGAIAPTICPAGSMCLAGCAVNLGVKCSLGYWQPEAGRTFCFTCPTGSYCNLLGLKAPVGLCKNGYYCLTSSSSEQPTIASQGGVCTERNYCPSGAVIQIPCNDGHFCTSTGNYVMDAANKCTAGYACYAAANIATPLDEASQGGSICPAGHYCLAATGSKDAGGVVILPIRCEPGTYRSNPGATSPIDCLTCPDGSYCESRGTGYAYDIDGFGKKIAVPVSLIVQTCDDGYICKATAGVGSVMPRPTGKFCPIGYKCNSGIDEKCPANTYQDLKGQSACKPCPVGYQCPISADGQSLYTTKIVCGQNFFCLNLSKDKTPCTAGTYTLSKVAGQLSECVNCPAGYICSTVTLTEPAVAVFTSCPAGQYCAEKTHAASPVVLCDKGYYCPLGTPLMIPCPPGFACLTTGLTAKPVAQDLCTAGYYCILASQSKTPTDGITGNICPAGSYCPSTEPLPFPVPCPLGTYRATTNAAAKADCTVCTSDQLCDERGLKNFKAAAVVCATGYYCPITGPKIECPAGAMCPLDQDRTIYIPCPAGLYQPNKLSLTCFSCPSGKYCPPATSTDTLNKILHPESKICPKGYYCPTKTEDYLPNACSDGYYNPFDGGSGISSCYKCPEGKVCQGTALIVVTGDCPIGFYCSADAVGQQKCPSGTYCPIGSSYPTNCPLGTYQPLTEQGAEAACVPCDNHKYCGERGITDMTSSSAGNCGDGFLCIKGANKGAMYPYPTAPQQGGLCTAGNYCSRTMVGPQPCLVGSYNPDMAQSVCKGCQKGILCDTTGMLAAIECPAGYYCPAYSVTAAYVKVACAIGTFNPVKNMGQQSDCLPCKLGSYCSGGGSTDVTGQCNSGTYCPIGSTAQDATGLAVHIIGTTVEGPCPKGYMCPVGTDAPLPCQPGTYNPLIGQTACVPCPAGFYCDEQGMSDDTFNEKDKRCDAGYFCKLGATEPYPLGDPTGKGDKCSPGNFCPQQSSAPTPCLAGFFETRYSSYECQTCPAGFYCPGATINPIECVAGYCPLGSIAPKLCPDGTYADEKSKRLTDAGGCATCPNAQYCNQGRIQAFCDAGYWCNFGASSPNSFSNKCEVGHFCPSGTTLPIRCPEGKYTATTGAKMSSECIDCPAGYYCIKNDSVARGCPKGHICPSHSISPTPCFTGTYNPKTLKTASKDCINCPAGYFCDDRGVVDYTLYECPEGHYCPDERQTRKPLNCPAGTYRNSTKAIDENYDCWACNEGNFCNEASIYPEPCDPGYACPLNSTKEYACPPGVYCPAMSPSSINCPAGYYCPQYRTYQYKKCGNGTYCPESSSAPRQCPAGTFGTGRTDNYDQLSSCIGCGLGQYSAQGTNTCDDCWPGYVCVGNATKPNPTNLKKDGGMICPAGFYCPKKSYTAIACPLSTYNDQPGAGFLNMCRSCQEGQYGNLVGATSCKTCAPGTISSAGSMTCKCQGLNRKYIADQGKCICQTGYEPVDGSAGNENGFTDCAQIIYERCLPQQLRDSNGHCKNVTDCGGQCNGNGTISIDFGICECDNIASIDSLCNAECQTNMPKVYFNSDGIIQIYDPLTNITTSALLQNTAGQAKCAKKDPTLCTVTTISMINDPNGNFGADFNLPTALPGNTGTQQRLVSNMYVGGPTYIDLKYNATDFPWLNQPAQPASDPQKTTSIFGDALPWYTSYPGGKRLLQTTAKYIQNPIVCTTMGSSILFENLSNTSYPIYLRDSLLNTNDDFDYGQFIQLPSILKSGTIKNFIFTFAEQGVYVFGDSRNKEKQTIISVMGPNGKCPEETQFLPQTADSLLRVNAKRRDVLLPPNWYFFFSVLVAFCLLILAFVLTIGFVVKRDWRQKYILPIEYQKSNYTAVERSDPEDKRAIVSINTEQMSIKFKHQNKRDVEEELIEANGDINLIKQVQKAKKKKEDLQLNQVEELKDRLGRHAAELEKLFGKKKGLSIEDDDYEEEVDHDDSDLELEIDALYKLVQRNSALLKGEDVQIEEKNQDFLDTNEEMDDAEKRRLEREEEERERERLKKEWMDAQNKKFEQDQADALERAQYDFEDKKNTVLQQQLIESKEIGQTFSNRLQQYGADGQEINQYMNDLQNKMQNVENLMHQDEDRQNDLLRMKLDARRAKRRKLEEKLEEVEAIINDVEKETIDLQQSELAIIQQDLQEELKEIENEEQREKQIIEEKLKMEKYDKLAEFEDKLKAAGSQKEFNLILAEYQKAQSDVEKELEKQRQKDNERLERDLKARKALARANAQRRKQQAFQDIEDDQKAKIDDQLREQQDIKHVLLQEDAEDQAHLLADQLAAALKETSKGEDQDMENKRRLEKQQKAKHDREIVQIIGQDLKIEKEQDREIQIEIEKLAKVFDPFQEKVHRRAELMNQLSEDLTKEEIEAVKKQIKALDDEVRQELKKDEKIQDDALRAKLEMRKRKKQEALERERAKKSELLQERIKTSLKNSDEYQVKKNDITFDIINEMIKNMQATMSESEVPAAIEKLIDEKHSRELQDLLLKMYEQKCVELKEEVLNIMQEKIARQQMARKNNHDRKRGIDAIISRSQDLKERARLEDKKAQLDQELEKELADIEKEYTKQESEMTIGIQKRTLDRENERVAQLQEEQLKEKNMIFNLYLPNSMLNAFLKDNADEERIELEKLRQDLQRINEERIKSLEEEKKLIDLEVNTEQSQVAKLVDVDKKEQDRLDKLDRELNEEKRKQESKVTASQKIDEIIKEFHKDSQSMSSVLNQERLAQMEKAKKAIEDRKRVQDEIRTKAEAEREQKEKEVKDLRETQVAKITAERAKRDLLLKTIYNKQKILLKECYSRPLYHFNRVLHENQVQNEDFNWLSEAKNSEIQRESIDELLQKIEKLGQAIDKDLNALTKTRV